MKKMKITVYVVTLLLALTASSASMAASRGNQCVYASTGGAAISGACAAMIKAAVSICTAAPFTVPVDGGISAGFLCSITTSGAALSCGLTIPAIVNIIKEC